MRVPPKLITLTLDAVVSSRSDLFSTAIFTDVADPELLLLSGSGVLELTEGVFTRFVPSVTVVPNVA